MVTCCTSAPPVRAHCTGRLRAVIGCLRNSARIVGLCSRSSIVSNSGTTWQRAGRPLGRAHDQPDLTREQVGCEQVRGPPGHADDQHPERVGAAAGDMFGHGAVGAQHAIGFRPGRGVGAQERPRRGQLPIEHARAGAARPSSDSPSPRTPPPPAAAPSRDRGSGCSGGCPAQRDGIRTSAPSGSPGRPLRRRSATRRPRSATGAAARDRRAARRPAGYRSGPCTSCPPSG